MLIVHTSDMHGKLTPEKAKKLFNLKRQGAILLDSGDALSAGNLDIRWRERTLCLMSLAGYTAGAIGNREFHPLPKLLSWKLKDADFPHLSANFVADIKVRKILPYLVLDIDDYRIAIIGLTLPQVRGFWEHIIPTSFYEPIYCGKEMEKELEKCDFLVFLTHLGIEKDITLAKELEKPSLILGGHNHISLEKPLKVNNSYIMHSGCYARTLGLIELGRGKTRGWLENL